MSTIENTVVVVHLHLDEEGLKRFLEGGRTSQEAEGTEPTVAPVFSRESVEENLQWAQESGTPVWIEVYTEKKGWHHRRIRVSSLFRDSGGLKIGATDLSLTDHGTPEEDAYRTFKVENIADVWPVRAST